MIYSLIIAGITSPGIRFRHFELFVLYANTGRQIITTPKSGKVQQKNKGKNRHLRFFLPLARKVLQAYLNRFDYYGAPDIVDAEEESNERLKVPFSSCIFMPN